MSYRKILVIDDSELSLEMVRDILEEGGYEVHTLDTPFGASAAIQQNQPDLVLLDLRMPGLSGARLLQIIKDNVQLQRTRVVLHSDAPVDELERIALESGADGFISKTSDGDVLLEKVRGFVGVSETTRAP